MRAKLFSGFAVLASMMLMLWLAGAVLQMTLCEDRRLDVATRFAEIVESTIAASSKPFILAR